MVRQFAWFMAIVLEDRDLCRAIDPDWASGPMQGVPAIEAKLKAILPDFF